MIGKPGQFVQNNMLIKVLSVIAACVLWLYIMYEQNPVISRSYVLELEKRAMPADLVLLDNFAGVRVKVSGPRQRMAEISAGDLTAYVDLQGLKKGVQDKEVQLAIPVGLQLEEIAPPVVAINADTLASRQFPVNVRFSELPPPDLSANILSVEPNTVRIYGPAQFVGRASLVEAALDIDQVVMARGKYKITATLSALDIDRNVLSKVAAEPNSVTLSMSVEDKVVTKEVPIKIAYTGSLPDGYRLTAAKLTPQTVTLTGLFAHVQNVNEVLTEGVALDNLTKDFSALLDLSVPARIRVDKYSAHVSLSITKE